MKETIAVVGLGFVGLPLALFFINKGYVVKGIDLDKDKLQLLEQGLSYLPDVPDDAVRIAFEQKSLAVTDNYSTISEADVIIICIPTPLTEEHTPDLSHLQQVGEALGKQIRRGQLVILESSTYPGTTNEVLKPLLEVKGMTVGEDIFLAYSPERIDPGNQEYSLESVSKVISGVTKDCAQRIYNLYSKVFQRVVPVSSPEVAELTKLLENTYRFVNISFINEFACVCDRLRINAWEVIEAASSKPYGFSAFYPGAGVGGHCIPVDPLYLLWRAQQFGSSSIFIESSHSINLGMPKYVIDRIKECLTVRTLEKVKILLIGVTYKRDINDIRESSAMGIMKLLISEGANLSYHDPYVPELTINGYTLKSIELSMSNLKNSDCAIIATNHSRLPIKFILDHAALVYDTRNVTKGLSGNARVVRLGAGDG